MAPQPHELDQLIQKATKAVQAKEAARLRYEQAGEDLTLARAEADKARAKVDSCVQQLLASRT